MGVFLAPLSLLVTDKLIYTHSKFHGWNWNSWWKDVIIYEGTPVCLLQLKAQVLPWGAFSTKTDPNSWYKYSVLWMEQAVKIMSRFTLTPPVLLAEVEGKHLSLSRGEMMRWKGSTETELTWLNSQSKRVSIHTGIWAGNFNPGSITLVFLHSSQRIASDP